MEMEIIATDEFICEECGEATEIKGYYNHTLRKLFPYCCCKEVIEIENHN